MKKLAFISVLAMVIGTCFIANAFADEFYVIPAQNKCGPCKGTRSEGGRWCDNGDSTVTDMTTCLVWLKYAAWGGQKSWEDCSTHDDAHTRASALKDGTVVQGLYGELTDGSVEGDWRLPTFNELYGILYGDECVRTTTPQFFVGVQGDSYWTSTTDASYTSNARYVVFTNGIGSTIKTTSYYVWPVRIAK